VSRFLDHAVRIIEIAEQVGQQSAGDLTVLVDSSGGMRIVQESNLSLAALRDMHGASMAYRVSRGAEGVQITGIEGGRTIQMASETTHSVAKRLLGGGFPRYILK
jgi:hypothetical protein